MTDCLETLTDAVIQAQAEQSPLRIHGGDSKRDIIGRNSPAGTPLDISIYQGISDYQPDELVLSARAGTPIGELEQTLDQQGQMLPFEPQSFDGRATLGGTLACNLSGPGRPWLGSVRDAVLGVQLINGRGQLLEFGGKVMKNVAGYDVSRLQAGALGTLGVITEIHLKVLPRPERSLTLAYEMDATSALSVMAKRAREAKPLSAACWVHGTLYLRLSGAESAVAHTARTWGGEQAESVIWQQLRDHSHPFFSGDAPLWRLSTDVHTPPQSEECIDWAGNQRWLRQKPESVAALSHLSLYAGGDRSAEVRPALDPVQQKLQLRLKQAMDPAGILNPGRLYSWM